MRIVARAAAVWIVVILGSATFASADTEKERADKLFEDGRKYLAAKEYALACTAFEQSHASDPAIGTQLNIALCYEAWGKTASAYRAYVEAERLAKIKFDDRATGARKKLDELGPTVPKLRLALPVNADPSLVILFDNKELGVDNLAEELLIDPGKHKVEARVAGMPPKASEFEIVNGESKTLEIDVPVAEAKVVPPPAIPPRRAGRLYGGIALISVGVLAIGGASFIALGAKQDYNDPNAIGMCPQFVCQTTSAYDATQDARKRANYMTIVGIGGAVLAGTGMILVLTSRGNPVEEKPVSILPVLGTDQVGIAIGGRL